jgi:hypothetical protein
MHCNFDFIKKKHTVANVYTYLFKIQGQKSHQKLFIAASSLAWKPKMVYDVFGPL